MTHTIERTESDRLWQACIDAPSNAEREHASTIYIDHVLALEAVR